MVEIERRESQPPKEGLSAEELCNLIAAVGNHEGKAMVFGAMNSHEIYTSWDLRKRVVALQGEKPGWLLDRSLPERYMQSSFINIGLVAREVMDANQNKFGYVKTKLGTEIGDALIGHLLTFSESSENSLKDFFGDTVTSSNAKDIKLPGTAESVKKRAPHTRYRIFGEVLKADLPIRQKDLADALDETQTFINDHLFLLSQRGIITYASTPSDTKFTSFSLNAQRSVEKPSAYKHHIVITGLVYDVVMAAGEDDVLTAAWVIDRIRENNKEYAGVSAKTFPKSVQEVLNYLQRLGYISRRSFYKGKQSDISLSDKQRSELSSLVGLLDKFTLVEPEFLKSGAQQLSLLLQNPGRVSRLMEKARSSTSKSMGIRELDVKEWILDTLRGSSNLSNLEIQRILKDKHGYIAGVSRIGKYTKALNESGQIDRVFNGTSHRFSIRS